MLPMERSHATTRLELESTPLLAVSVSAYSLARGARQRGQIGSRPGCQMSAWSMVEFGALLGGSAPLVAFPVLGRYVCLGNSGVEKLHVASCKAPCPL